MQRVTCAGGGRQRVGERCRIRANFGAFVMRYSYASGAVPLVDWGSDPNGIRTRVTAVKGRCPGPLDDRVTKPGNIGIAIVRRKANWQLILEYSATFAF
jgi:hypothetical protein